MDIREHSEAHHQVLAQLIDRLGEQQRPYGEFSRSERRDLLSAELTSHRPLTSSARPAGRRGGQDLLGVHRDQQGAGDLRPRGDRHLHHVDDDGVRRHPGGRRAGQGGRPDRRARDAGRPRSRPLRQHRIRSPAGDRRRTAQVGPGGRRTAQRPDLPGDRPAARRRPGGHAGLLGLEQAVGHHHQPVGDPQDPARVARPGGPARRLADPVPRSRRHRRPRRRSDLRLDPGPAARRARRRHQVHRAGRGDQRQVRPAGPRQGEPRAHPRRDAAGDRPAPVLAAIRGAAAGPGTI